MPYESLKTHEATAVGFVTCVGYMGDFPRDHGNCFDLQADDDFFYRILNFGHENFEELLRRGTITWPVKIHIVRPVAIQRRGLAVIHDERIPNEWYDTRFCSICCPHDLLPLPQRLHFDREVLRGDVTISEGIISRKIRAQPHPLRSKWSVGAEEDMMLNEEGTNASRSDQS